MGKKPEVEKKLETLQENYLKNKCKKNENSFFFELEKLTRNIVKGKFKGRFFADPEYINDIVQETMFYMVRHFKKSNFKITGSFTGYLRMACLYPMYGAKKKKKEKAEISINKEIDKDGHTLYDLISGNKYELDFDDNGELCYKLTTC
jgi:hypothetical protein